MEGSPPHLRTASAAGSYQSRSPCPILSRSIVSPAARTWMTQARPERRDYPQVRYSQCYKEDIRYQTGDHPPQRGSQRPASNDAVCGQPEHCSTVPVPRFTSPSNLSSRASSSMTPSKLWTKCMWHSSLASSASFRSRTTGKSSSPSTNASCSITWLSSSSPLKSVNAQPRKTKASPATSGRQTPQ